MKKNLLGLGVFFIAFLAGIFLFQVPPTYAGGKIQIDDTKWVDFGMGIRSSYTGTEDGAPNGDFGNNIGLDNFRLYMNGQIHEYIKFEFNTETTPFSINGTDNDTDMFVLDAIAKFEFNQYINIWAGRMLAASDRAELSGPFFASTYTFNKTPFYPQDFGNFNAGKFGRDDGVNLWGALGKKKRFTYVAGLFDGLDSSLVNSSDSMLFAARVSYNFLNVEKNPGYYTSRTYYGEAGDIFTVAYALQRQNHGAGSAIDTSDFTGMSADLLYETKLADNSVVTIEGEVKHFDANYDKSTCGGDAGDFCIFDGDSWLAKGLYMFPHQVGIGHFQPYVVYTGVSPDAGNSQFEFEGGLNYVIDGHKAKASLFYQYGDIDRFDFSGLDNRNQYTIGLALQFQLL